MLLMHLCKLIQKIMEKKEKKRATCPSTYNILLLLKGMKILINNLNFNKDLKERKKKKKKRKREKKKYGFQKYLNPIRSQI